MNMTTSIHHNIVAIISLCFALTGFTYNAWRLEQSEQNNNFRAACFQLLLEMGALEQVIFHLHYDQDASAGNPRSGWVKVGLIRDFSLLLDGHVNAQAKRLVVVWARRWPSLGKNEAHAQEILTELQHTRRMVIAFLENIQ